MSLDHGQGVPKRGLLGLSNEPEVKASSELLKEIERPVKRIKTGVLGLDDLVEGGFLSSRVYLVGGPLGGGKTTFGIQYIAFGAHVKEPGLYITMMENPKNIVQDMSQYPFKLPEMIKKGKIHFLDFGGIIDETSASIEFPTISQLTVKIKEFVEKKKIKRLVIDSISDVKFVGTDRNYEKKQMVEFVRNLEEMGCTTVLLSEMEDPSKYSAEHFLVHGVVFLHNFLVKDKMTRALQILKMRGTRHDCDMHKMSFTSNGMRVYTTSI